MHWEINVIFKAFAIAKTSKKIHNLLLPLYYITHHISCLFIVYLIVGFNYCTGKYVQCVNTLLSNHTVATNVLTTNKVTVKLP